MRKAADDFVFNKVQTQGKARIVQEGGRTWLVAPCSSINPGVLNGSNGAGYYPPDETSKAAPLWNGIPITLYHPTDHVGNHVSARYPGILQKSGLGEVRKSVFNGKLRHELWLDKDRTFQLHKGVHDAVENGDPVEVSTGLKLYHDMRPGVSPQGVAYDWVARNHQPDHLAILPDQVGACSIHDGCGLNVNQSKEKPMPQITEAWWMKVGRKLGIVGNAGVNQPRHETGKYLPHGSGTGKGEVHAGAKAGFNGNSPNDEVEDDQQDKEIEDGVTDLNEKMEEETTTNFSEQQCEDLCEDSEDEETCMEECEEGVVDNCRCGGACDKCKETTANFNPNHDELGRFSGEGGGSHSERFKALSDSAMAHRKDDGFKVEAVKGHIEKMFQGMTAKDAVAKGKEMGVLTAKSKSQLVDKLHAKIEQRVAASQRGDAIEKAAKGVNNMQVEEITDNANPEGHNQYTSGANSSTKAANKASKDAKSVKDSPGSSSAQVRHAHAVAGDIHREAAEDHKNAAEHFKAAGNKEMSAKHETAQAAHEKASNYHGQQFEKYRAKAKAEAVTNGKKIATNQSGDEDMPKTKDQMVQYLTTNCSCWKDQKSKEVLNAMTPEQVEFLFQANAKKKEQPEAKDPEEEDEDEDMATNATTQVNPDFEVIVNEKRQELTDTLTIVANQADRSEASKKAILNRLKSKPSVQELRELLSLVGNGQAAQPKREPIYGFGLDFNEELTDNAGDMDYLDGPPATFNSRDEEVRKQVQKQSA